MTFWQKLGFDLGRAWKFIAFVFSRRVSLPTATFKMREVAVEWMAVSWDGKPVRGELDRRVAVMTIGANVLIALYGDQEFKPERVAFIASYFLSSRYPGAIPLQVRRTFHLDGWDVLIHHKALPLLQEGYPLPRLEISGIVYLANRIPV